MESKGEVEDAEVPENPRWRWAVILRWLHVYVSMFAFAILFFFAVTGLTLNHPDWFSSGPPRRVQIEGNLKREWVAAGGVEGVAKLEMVEFLRGTHGLKGAVGDWRIEEKECSLSFKGPGYSADVFVDRETGSYQLAETRMGLTALVNDLHKGRDTGRGWSWVIDVSAVLMAVVSLTGLALIWFVRRRRASGLLWAALGTGMAVAAYAWLVP